MKLGNSSAAMGVGVYFFILRLMVSGRGWQVGAWVVLSVAWSASCSLLVRRVQVVILYVCYEWRICSVWQVAWCGIDVWAIIHMSLSEWCNLLPFWGGWFEERRGASRVVTNPTRMCERWTWVNYWLWLSLACVGNWVFIFTDLQRMADLFDLTSCVMS